MWLARLCPDSWRIICQFLRLDDCLNLGFTLEHPLIQAYINSLPRVDEWNCDLDENGQDQLLFKILTWHQVPTISRSYIMKFKSGLRYVILLYAEFEFVIMSHLVKDEIDTYGDANIIQVLKCNRISFDRRRSGVHVLNYALTQQWNDTIMHILPLCPSNSTFLSALINNNSPIALAVLQLDRVDDEVIRNAYVQIISKRCYELTSIALNKLLVNSPTIMIRGSLGAAIRFDHQWIPRFLELGWWDPHYNYTYADAAIRHGVPSHLRQRIRDYIKP